MPTANAVVFSPQVREAFDEACRAIFGIRSRRVSLRGAPHVVYLPGFATRYQQLRALPRRTRRAHQRRWKCALSVIALLMTLGQTPAWAANIFVSPATPPSIKSDGKCSLIEAIVNANRDARTHLDCVAGAGADTIILPELSQQILKSREILPNIWSKIVIEGNGSTIRRDAALDFSSTSLDYLFITAAGDLTLNETTVSGESAICMPNGLCPPSGRAGISNAGGSVSLQDSFILDAPTGLSNSGIATLTDSTISGNGDIYFGGGGGISNHSGGTLVLRHCRVTGNSPGISNGRRDQADSGSSLTLIDSTVSGNATPYEGVGGGLANRGTALIVRSTFSENWAYWGGGIFNAGTGIATLIRSTVSGNTANYGGGVANTGSMKLTNSTVSNNTANHHGGGLLEDYSVTNQGALILASSTVTGNSARYDGGGLMLISGTVTLKRSIVSGNSVWANSGGRELSNPPYASGVVLNSDDYNLIGHDGDAGVLGATLGSTDIVPNQPLNSILLPLADNGGNTRTHALAIGSPALNASPDDASCPAIDQRGNPRPRGAACDIGSFEGSAVLCGGKVTTQVGTVGADDLTGTPRADVISGLSGSDVIVGLDGNDVICAGGGADQAYGGIGNDLIFGEPGNDRLFGQRGDDTLNGGADQDYCDGGSQSGAGDTATACETIIEVP